MTAKLGLTPNELCNRAVSYVKGLFKDEPGDPPTVQLPFDDSMVFKPLCDGLGVTYVVDAGDRFEYVQYRDLRSAGMTLEQLHEIGVRNLSAICKERLEIRLHSNIYAFLMRGNFESSCILVDDMFDRVLSEHIRNGYVAALPTRDILAVCSRDSAVGIRELRALVERTWPGGDHLVSRQLYVRDDRLWRPMNADDLADVIPRRERRSSDPGPMLS